MPSLPVAALSLSLLAAAVSAADRPVEAWLTRIADGDRRDGERAFATAGKPGFDERQDEGRDLWRKVPIQADGVPAGGPSITIDRMQRFQIMQGYGAGMTDASAALLQRLQERSPALYAQVMERFFSPVTGAGFGVLRVTVGASDYTAEPRYFTHCDQESADLAGFSIDVYRKAVIPQILAAKRLQPKLTVIASPWSPPAWMKTNGKLEGISGEAKGKGATNRLKPECFPLYADYLVRFVKEMRAAGVPVTAITLQNEPQFDAAAYPCMRMTEDEQVRLAVLVMGKAAGLSPALRIFVHDHNAVLHPNDRQVVGGDRKLEPQESVTAMLTDPAGAQHIAGSAWHWYSGNAAQTAAVYDALHARFPDKALAFTEGTGWGFKRGAWYGTIDWGMAHAWMLAPLHWAEMCLMWNLVLDDKGGPTLRDDSQGVGLGTVDAATGKEMRFEREFYAMAHLSRAAQPGSRRIAATVTEGGKLSSVAFLQPDGRVALAVFNRGPSTALRIAEGSAAFRVDLPEKSIATFVW